VRFVLKTSKRCYERKIKPRASHILYLLFAVDKITSEQRWI